MRGWINGEFGLPNTVDYCSGWYTGGELTGFGTSLLLGYGALNAARGGAAIASVEDILSNPELLSGKTAAEVEELVGDSPGWRVERLGRGTHEGQGWLLREYDDAGNPTGRLIRWHPGGGQHGPDPYWRVSSPTGGKSGIIR